MSFQTTALSVAAIGLAGRAANTQATHHTKEQWARYSAALTDAFETFKAKQQGPTPITVKVPRAKFDAVGFSDAKELGFNKPGASSWILTDMQKRFHDEGFKLIEMGHGKESDSIIITAKKESTMNKISWAFTH